MMQRYLCLGCEYKVNDDGVFAEVRVVAHVGATGHKMIVVPAAKAKEAA